MNEKKVEIGNVVSFETFKKPKQILKGEVIKIFISTKDKKEYCQIRVDKKIYCKQTLKVTLEN